MKKLIGVLIIFVLLIIGIVLNYIYQKDVITESMAKTIVLNDLKKNEEDFYFSHIYLVKENQKEFYNIEFNDNTYIYTYKINAHNKKIINVDKEKITDVIYYINEDDILDIIMKHAKLEKKQCNIISNKIIMDEIPYYETIFYYNNIRYEYKTNALIGDIISVVKLNEKDTQ